MFYKLIKKQGSHTKLLAVKDMEKKGVEVLKEMQLSISFYHALIIRKIPT